MRYCDKCFELYDENELDIDDMDDGLCCDCIAEERAIDDAIDARRDFYALHPSVMRGFYNAKLN